MMAHEPLPDKQMPPSSPSKRAPNLVKAINYFANVHKGGWDVLELGVEGTESFRPVCPPPSQPP